MFKRMLEIIKWIPRAPTALKALPPGTHSCDYCGSGMSLWNYQHSHCICTACMKKIADKVLRETIDHHGV